MEIQKAGFGMKKVSVVILNWNGEKLLSQFLPSVLKFTDLQYAEIVVADNNSEDNSVAYVEKNYPQIKIIRFTENYGFAEGYNRALQNIDSQYVVLLNSDVEVTENWLSPAIEYMDKNSAVAALQPKILSYRDKQCFEYAGAAGGYIDKYGYPFCRGRIFSNLEKDHSQYDHITEIFWASGACLFIRLDDFLQAGGFDSTFFAHMEEIDLCWRLNARGRKLICYPQSVVYHVGAATLSSENPHKTYLNFRNNLLMLYKNLPGKSLKRTLVIRSVLDYVAALQMVLSGKYNNARAVRQAHKEFKKIKNTYNRAREINLQESNLTVIKTIYDKSILWNYYVKQKKTFDKLGIKL